ncbi:MAG: PEGA domain-containing protein [Bacteroidales bacterium]|nr:PEGA domain-containing protein [Bacteroidales bacterium]
MRCILTFIVVLLPLVSGAQSFKQLEIDASRFELVQTDALSCVAIDKIGTDLSRRPCARIKMHINRMARNEIEGISVRPVGGSVVVDDKNVGRTPLSLSLVPQTIDLVAESFAYDLMAKTW